MGQGNNLSLTSKVTGPLSSAIKYDLLTALLVLSAQGDKVEARLALRLSLLITARFNWRKRSFAVGLKEMANMWGVTERTAKREVASLRHLGWVHVLIPPARGRVAQYGINFDELLRCSACFWASVGPDFEARMNQSPEPASEERNNVVPLKPVQDNLPTEDGSVWSRAVRRLQTQDAAIFNAWFATLYPVELEAGVLTLLAPSRFMADYVTTHFSRKLLTAVAAEDRGVRDVKVIWTA